MNDVIGVIVACIAIFIHLRAAIYGYRYGLIEERIRIPPRETGKYYEGVQAKRVGWFLLIAGTALSVLFFYGLLLLLSRHFLLV